MRYGQSLLVKLSPRTEILNKMNRSFHLMLQFLRLTLVSTKMVVNVKCPKDETLRAAVTQRHQGERITVNCVQEKIHTKYDQDSQHIPTGETTSEVATSANVPVTTARKCNFSVIWSHPKSLTRG